MELPTGDGLTVIPVGNFSFCLNFQHFYDIIRTEMGRYTL